MNKTINKIIKFSGIELHNGEISNVVLVPAPEYSGIYINNKIVNTNNISFGHMMSKYNDISLTEHLFSALKYLGINNLFIYCDNTEIPILNGSSIEFVNMLKNNIKCFNSFIDIYKINSLIEFKFNDRFVKIEPSDKFEINCITDFPYIGKEQYYFCDFNKYENEIAHINTFLPRKWVNNELNCNNLKGLDENKNMTVYTKNNLPPKCHFPKHKILDIIGDINVLNFDIIGKITSYKGGHYYNNNLCIKIYDNYLNNLKKYVTVVSINKALEIIKIHNLKPYYDLDHSIFEIKKYYSSMNYLEYNSFKYIYPCYVDNDFPLPVFTNTKYISPLIQYIDNCVLTILPNNICSNNLLYFSKYLIKYKNKYSIVHKLDKKYLDNTIYILS